MKEAICAAEELGHTYIGSEHLLLGLLEEGSNAAAAMLAAQHITAQRVRNALVELVGRGIPAQVQEDCLTPALSEIMQQAKAFSKEDGRSLAGTEHLLRSILRTPCCTAVAILKKLGVSLNQLGQSVGRKPLVISAWKNGEQSGFQRKHCRISFSMGSG